jgi:hypothetical protein
VSRWLIAGAVVVAVVLFLLWRQLSETSAATTAASAPAAQPAAVPIVASPPPVAKQAPAEAPAKVAAPDPAKPEKLDPQSDEFFRLHDEMVVPRLSRNAVRCIENRPEEARDRHKSLVLKFKQRVRDGKVEVTDVTIDRSSLTDPALEACFIQQVRNTSWTDERMPDWDQDDEIKLGYRQLKKYTRANIEYVGEEAPPMMEKPADH